MSNDKINYYVNEYHKLSEATSYELYFAYKKVLHKIELAEISIDMVRLTTESQKNGGTEKLKLYVNNKKKAELIASGKAQEVMSTEKFEELAQELGYNKGQTCEYIATTNRNLSFKLDNVRFDKAGDINIGRHKIQVKFENATLVNCSTIDKLVG